MRKKHEEYKGDVSRECRRNVHSDYIKNNWGSCAGKTHRIYHAATSAEAMCEFCLRICFYTIDVGGCLFEDMSTLLC